MWVFFLECRDARLRLREGETVIGRGEDCGFYVEDPAASRRHALVRREGNRLTVTDLGSSNGTFLNGARVEGTVEIVSNDRLLIGETTIAVGSVSIEDADDAPRTLPPVGEVVGLGIEILEQRTERPHSRVQTEPQFSSIDVLESLLTSPHSLEEPRALATMIKSSVERLLVTSRRRGDPLGADNTARVLAIVEGVRGLVGDGSFDDWAADVRQRLQS